MDGAWDGFVDRLCVGDEHGVDAAVEAEGASAASRAAGRPRAPPAGVRPERELAERSPRGRRPADGDAEARARARRGGRRGCWRGCRRRPRAGPSATSPVVGLELLVRGRGSGARSRPSSGGGSHAVQLEEARVHAVDEDVAARAGRRRARDRPLEDDERARGLVAVLEARLRCQVLRPGPRGRTVGTRPTPRRCPGVRGPGSPGWPSPIRRRAASRRGRPPRWRRPGRPPRSCASSVAGCAGGASRPFTCPAPAVRWRGVADRGSAPPAPGCG